MMAKMFYTLEETKATLGKSEDEIKQLTREGRLREFRDGPRLMYKADQVDSLKNELASGRDQVDLGPSDTGAGSVIGLADSGKGGSGTAMTLSDDTAAGGRSPGAMAMKDDTALAADLGLSGSLGGMPSPSRTGGGSGSGLSGTSRSGSGVSVFNPDEVELADPSAQTAISAGVSDQMNLEGVGSGSGLLDLTRESDDTSLGAELLDEIAPSGATRQRGEGAVAGSGLGSMSGLEEPRGGPIRTVGAVRYEEAADPLAPAFGAMALAAAIVCGFGIFVLTNAVVGVWPQFIADYRGNPQALWAFFGGGLALAIVLFIVGWFVGKR
jgi:hypothetical protein